MESKILDYQDPNDLYNEIEPYLAPKDKRFLNYVIDTAVYVFYIIALMIFDWTFVEGTDLESDYGLFAGMNLFFFPFVYKCFFEGLFGKTLGKYFTQTQVVKLNGEPITFLQAFARSVVRYTIIDVLSIFIDGEKPWHDTFTQTRVVMDEYEYSEFV